MTSADAYRQVGGHEVGRDPDVELHPADVTDPMVELVALLHFAEHRFRQADQRLGEREAEGVGASERRDRDEGVELGGARMEPGLADEERGQGCRVDPAQSVEWLATHEPRQRDLRLGRERVEVGLADERHGVDCQLEVVFQLFGVPRCRRKVGEVVDRELVGAGSDEVPRPVGVGLRSVGGTGEPGCRGAAGGRAVELCSEVCAE